MIISIVLAGCHTEEKKPSLDISGLAKTHFDNDAEWFKTNVPSFECSDKEIEQV
jgi:hypothetical protein